MGSLTYTDSQGVSRASGFTAIQQPDFPQLEASAQTSYLKDLSSAVRAVGANFETAAEGFDEIWATLGNLLNVSVYDSSFGKAIVNGKNHYVKFANGLLIQWGILSTGVTYQEFQEKFADDQYTIITNVYNPAANSNLCCSVKGKVPHAFSVSVFAVPDIYPEGASATVAVSLQCDVPYWNGDTPSQTQGVAHGNITVPKTRVDWPDASMYMLQWVAFGRWL